MYKNQIEFCRTLITKLSPLLAIALALAGCSGEIDIIDDTEAFYGQSAIDTVDVWECHDGEFSTWNEHATAYFVGPDEMYYRVTVFNIEPDYAAFRINTRTRLQEYGSSAIGGDFGDLIQYGFGSIEALAYHPDRRQGSIDVCVRFNDAPDIIGGGVGQ